MDAAAMIWDGPDGVTPPHGLQLRRLRSPDVDPRIVLRRRLWRELGGAVYEAEHLDLGMLVHVAIVPGEGPQAAPERVARSLGAASACARARDPHLPLVHDAGTLDDGSLYVVYQPPSPTRLRDVLARRVMTPFEAVAVAQSLCRALEALHAQGHAYGRVCPEVIVLEADPVGEVDVRLGALPAPAPMPGFEPGVYRSPERRSNEAATAGDDVYAVAAVLFEMLTGELPAEQPTGGLPDPRLFAPDCPEVLAQIVVECTQPEANLRPREMWWLSAALLCAAEGLEQTSSGHGISSAPPPAITQPFELVSACRRAA